MINLVKILNFLETSMGMGQNQAIYATIFITLVAYLCAYPLLIMFVWNSVVENLYPNDPQDMLEKRKMSYLTAFCIILLTLMYL